MNYEQIKLAAYYDELEKIAEFYGTTKPQVDRRIKQLGKTKPFPFASKEKKLRYKDMVGEYHPKTSPIKEVADYAKRKQFIENAKHIGLYSVGSKGVTLPLTYYLGGDKLIAQAAHHVGPALHQIGQHIMTAIK